MGYLDDIRKKEAEKDSLRTIANISVLDSVKEASVRDSVLLNRTPVKKVLEKDGKLANLTPLAKVNVIGNYYKNLKGLQLQFKLINNHNNSLANIKQGYLDDIGSISNDILSYNYEIEAANNLPGADYGEQFGAWSSHKAGYPLGKGGAIVEPNAFEHAGTYQGEIKRINEKILAGTLLNDNEVKTLATENANKIYRRALDTYESWENVNHDFKSLGINTNSTEQKKAAEEAGYLDQLSVNHPGNFINNQIALAHTVDDSQANPSRSRGSYDYTYSSVEEGVDNDNNPILTAVDPMNFSIRSATNIGLKMHKKTGDLDISGATTLIYTSTVPNMSNVKGSYDGHNTIDRVWYYSQQVEREQLSYQANVDKFLAEYDVPLDSKLALSLRYDTVHNHENYMKDWDGKADEAWDRNKIKHVDY